MSLTSAKALIIDDDADLCRLLADVLEHLNFDVSTANSLAKGKQELKSTHPYLVFLDQNLPDGLGTDFIPTIRAFDSSIAIVVITADISAALKQKVIGEENTYFLSKPFSITGVMDVVHTIRQVSPNGAGASVAKSGRKVTG